MAEAGATVIVGAGMAGAKTAEALRARGDECPIVLIGEEPELPYERPPLSKDYLRGEAEREGSQVLAAGFYADNAIDLRTDCRVETIDSRAREVILDDGEGFSFERLLIATGAEPRRLDLPAGVADRVHYLRDLRDADALSARLRDGGTVAVIGAGWIGCEIAASARQKGMDVVLVEHASSPLERVLGPRVGGIFADLHRDNGVDLVTGASVESIAGSADGGAEVALEGGRRIGCDFVVAGIGVTPRAELAAAAGLDVDNGVLVDEHLESSVGGIFAAGDVANALHPFYGRHVRVEHWANALHQPEVVAAAMLGETVTYDRIPYFFSDQYDLGMEYTGLALRTDEVIFRGDPESREFVAFWVRDGRVTAGMNVNVWDVAGEIEELIRSREEVPVERLVDTGAPIA